MIFRLHIPPPRDLWRKSLMCIFTVPLELVMNEYLLLGVESTTPLRKYNKINQHLWIKLDRRPR